MKYNDYDTWKVDAFEPMLIYMVQTDVDNATTDSKQTWTFNNVDVNYEYLEDKNYNRQYNKQDNPTIKAGDVDKTLNGFSGNNYTLYTFTGTFVTSYNIMDENDYYIRDNKFYKFEGSNKYASRGFRGWFHYNGNAKAAKNKVNIDIVNGDSGEVTKITTADIDTNTDNTVYDIAGRKIANTKNLSRGIYIVNGKKIIVK